VYRHHVQEHGQRLFDEASKSGLEGIVAKKADSSYVAGRNKDWIKVETESGKARDKQGLKRLRK
jgi:bifunctional non-homologous end joining protein LigD